ASLAWTNPDSRPEPLERVDDAGASLDEVPGAGPVQFLQGESPRKRWWLRGPLSRVNGGRFHNTAGTHLLFPLSLVHGPQLAYHFGCPGIDPHPSLRGGLIRTPIRVRFLKPFE